MQPAYEDVGTNAAAELACRERRICNLRTDVATAMSSNSLRIFFEQGQNHGNIMRREAPQDVLLGAQLANIQARGIDVLHADQLAFAHQSLQFPDGRMGLE